MGRRLSSPACNAPGRMPGRPCHSMQIEALHQRLAGLGAKPVHARRILRAWVQAGGIDTRHVKAGDFLPRTLRQALPAFDAELDALVHIRSEHPGEDGATRLLMLLADGQAVESVLLPRGGLCVSTQVGCAVGCVFCMTGRGGLSRQLSSAEIVAQVAVARRRRAVNKVVFMGMGEPAHNLDNVMAAIDFLGREANIGHKELVFSSVGDRRVFERLPQGPVKPALALSLHTADPELRARLLPRAPRIDPAELVELGERYARATRYPIQYQWTLIEGVNDGDADIDAIARLLKGRYAVMNLIPFNRVDGFPYRRPRWERAAEMARALHRRGVLTKLRHSAGQAVDGGCGQLRARHAGTEVQPSPARVRKSSSAPASPGVSSSA